QREGRTRTGQALGALGAWRTGYRWSPMTIRGGGHPKPTMVLAPFLRMDPPPRSFAADAHDCIMVRDPLDRPNTRLWRDDPRPMASSPLIVEAPLSPAHLSSSPPPSAHGGACSGHR